MDTIQSIESNNQMDYFFYFCLDVTATLVLCFIWQMSLYTAVCVCACVFHCNEKHKEREERIEGKPKTKTKANPQKEQSNLNIQIDAANVFFYNAIRLECIHLHTYARDIVAERSTALIFDTVFLVLQNYYLHFRCSFL